MCSGTGGPSSSFHQLPESSPPSTISVWPLTNEASSEARKSTAAACSSTRPGRRSGMRPHVGALAREVVAGQLGGRLGRDGLAGGDAVDAQPEVPELVRERARERDDGGLRRVVGRLGDSPWKTLAEAIETIAPPPLRTCAARPPGSRRTARVTLVANVRSKSSSPTSRIGPSGIIPALLTSTCSRPNAEIACSTIAAASAASAMSPARVWSRGLASSAAVCARRGASRSAASTVAPSRRNAVRSRGRCRVPRR